MASTPAVGCQTLTWLCCSRALLVSQDLEFQTVACPHCSDQLLVPRFAQPIPRAPPTVSVLKVEPISKSLRYRAPRSQACIAILAVTNAAWSIALRSDPLQWASRLAAAIALAVLAYRRKCWAWPLSAPHVERCFSYHILRPTAVRRSSHRSSRFLVRLTRATWLAESFHHEARLIVAYREK
jgi:hypothetical protein